MKYNTIVIDPAWDITLGGIPTKRRENRAIKLPYKVMSLEEIKNFPIKDFANDGCHVYCWTTNKMIWSIPEVFKAWNVRAFLIMPLVKPSGIIPSIYGYVFASEFCVLGFYNPPMQKFIGTGKLNWFKSFNKAGQHSRKPDEFYNVVKKMSPAPRIDIFSRRVIAGFDAWGDEAPKEKQLELTHSPISNGGLGEIGC